MDVVEVLPEDERYRYGNKAELYIGYKYTEAISLGNREPNTEDCVFNEDEGRCSDSEDDYDEYEYLSDDEIHYQDVVNTDGDQEDEDNHESDEDDKQSEQPSGDDVEFMDSDAEEDSDCSDDDSDEDKGDKLRENSKAEKIKQKALKDKVDKPNVVEEPKNYLGRDRKYVWYRDFPESPVSKPSKIETSIANREPSFNLSPADFDTEYDIWSLFFDYDMLNLITTCTNEQIKRAQSIVPDPHTRRPTDPTEMKALIGWLLIAGACRCSYYDTEELYEPFSLAGHELFQYIMCEARFKFLVECLRFEIIPNASETNQTEEEAEDKLKPIRTLWEMFVAKCSQYNNPTAAYPTLLVQSKLWDFFGKCPFRVRNQSQKEQFGLKMVTLVDSKKKYIINAVPYCGQFEALDQLLKQVTKPIRGSNRALVVDPSLMTIPAVDEMLTEHSIRILGQLLVNPRTPNREIPSDLLPSSTTKALSHKTVYTDHSEMVSYCPRRNVGAVLLSTFNSEDFKVTPPQAPVKVDPRRGKLPPESPKPDSIKFYRNWKQFGKKIDDRIYELTVSRLTSRWSLRFFYGMLDLAAHNASVIAKDIIGPKKIEQKEKRDIEKAKKKNKRARKQAHKYRKKDFLIPLGYKLIQQHVERRLEMDCGTSEGLDCDLKEKMEQFLKDVHLREQGVDLTEYYDEHYGEVGEAQEEDDTRAHRHHQECPHSQQRRL